MADKQNNPATKTEQAPAQADANYLQDEYAGVGGQYVVDSKTGKRTPAPAQADAD
jgi:hypothetical protein